jgi:agmatinase
MSQNNLIQSLTINNFNQNNARMNNNNFAGLPFDSQSAKVILVPVPWEVTVSYCEGTSMAPQRILDESFQIDLYDSLNVDGWKQGIYAQPVDQNLLLKNNELRELAKKHIDYSIGKLEMADQEVKINVDTINQGCEEMNTFVRTQTQKAIESGKLVGLIGGDHSVPLGYIQTLANNYEDFGILHIDAHFDLRNNYEDFTYSHASIFYNTMSTLPQVSKLVQVGIRDYCDEELEVANTNPKIEVFFDRIIKDRRLEGETWGKISSEIISKLPDNVYISFDIDGLDPKLCPATGTPVPGGIDYDEIVYLITKLAQSGKKIIGFDLVEVGSERWDANVGMRLIYKMCNAMLLSQK